MPYLLSGQAPGGGAAAAVSSTHQCSLKFTSPAPPLFSNRRPKSLSNGDLAPRRTRHLTLTNAAEPANRGPASTATKTNPEGTSQTFSSAGDQIPSPISFVTEDNLEGVIQFEKPNTTSSLFSKWGRVALLAGGDVMALVLFSAIGRFSHGFSVFDFETLKTADPFIAGWFLSAYFLGGYGEDGRGMNGVSNAVLAAAKSWALGIPLGLIIRASAVGHIPPTNFILVTMGSTAFLLVGWRALLFTIFPKEKDKKNDVYKRGSPFELFELLTSLVRRW